MNYKERLKDYLDGYSSQYNFKDENDIEHDLNNDIEEMLKQNQKLEQALDKIEKYLKNDIENCNGSLSNPEYTIINKHGLLKNEKQKDIDILKIIQKAKGDVKNEI